MNTAGAYPSDQTNQENVTSSNINIQLLPEHARNYVTVVFHARASLAAAFQRQLPTITLEYFCTNSDSDRARELEARNKLQRHHDRSVENLGSVRFRKKVSTVSFTFATAISAAIATAASNAKKSAAAAAVAAAASILFGGLGKWMRSNLQREESALKKDINFVGAMVEGAEVIIRDLEEIKDLASRYQARNNTSIADGGASEVNALEQKQAALVATLQEFEGKVENYCRHVSWAREMAVNSITQNYVPYNCSKRKMVCKTLSKLN